MVEPECLDTQQTSTINLDIISALETFLHAVNILLNTTSGYNYHVVLRRGVDEGSDSSLIWL